MRNTIVNWKKKFEEDLLPRVVVARMNRNETQEHPTAWMSIKPAMHTNN